MKMALVLCATIIFSLLPLSASQPPMVIASSSDMTAIPGDTRTFTCTFIGHSVPYWVVNGGDSPVTITLGNTVSFFTMPNVPPIVDSGTVAQLEVSVDLSLNGTTYVCHIDIAGGTTVASDPAKLTVFGPPLAPFAINSRERYQSVRMGWETPWSSDLAPVTSYAVRLLESDADGGAVLQTDMVVADGNGDREKTFDNLMHNTDYKAQVAAVNSAGQGPWSNEVTFTTPFPNLPTPPVDITLTVAIAGGEATVTVSWTAPTIDLEFQTKVTEYTIFYGSGDFTNEVTRPASDTFYEIQNLELFSTFQLKMTATNSRGTSEESGAVSKDIQYLQAVSGVGGLKHLNISCTFASSIDIALQCSVDLAGPTAMTVFIPKETSSVTAVMMVPGLDAGKYNITAKALRVDGSEASPYARKQYLIAVTTDATGPPPSPDNTSSETPKPSETSTPEPSATPTPSVAPMGTTEQIGIIAGSCQTTVTVTVLSVLLSLALAVSLSTCAVSAVVVAVMYKRLQRCRAELRGGPEGEGPPTTEEEEGGEKMQANPAYLSIEMSYKSQEDKYIDVPS